MYVCLALVVFCGMVVRKCARTILLRALYNILLRLSKIQPKPLPHAVAVLSTRVAHIWSLVSSSMWPLRGALHKELATAMRGATASVSATLSTSTLVSATAHSLTRSKIDTALLTAKRCGSSATNGDGFGEWLKAQRKRKQWLVVEAFSNKYIYIY